MASTSRPKTRARLRTKTGCLTCRRRRKKCDEVTPSCGECSFASRQCQWPGTEDLLDRRFASHENSRHRPRLRNQDAESKPRSVTSKELVRFAKRHEGGLSVTIESARASLPSLGRIRAESRATFILVSRDMSVALSRHFVERYYGLLLLPACHPRFYHSWLTEIQALMDSCKSLHYSVLACSASHIHLSSKKAPSGALAAIKYYTNATKELSGLIEHTAQPEGDNGLLTSVILMYLHGCMGLGTYSDIPIHVNAAIRILTMRLFSSHDSITHLFDRLAVESVLYQVFLVTTGLWTQPAGTVYAFDPDFWARADGLLDRSAFFPGQPKSLNSPVLGIPTSLFRLALTLRQQFGSGLPPERDLCEAAKTEVDDWEAALLSDACSSSDDDSSDQGNVQQIYNDAERLYAVIVSLLLEQITHRDVSNGPPFPEPSQTWQVRKAIGILKRHENDLDWSRCYIGNWPVYTIGFFMESAEDRRIVRNDMQRRWDEIGFAQIARFRQDLEITWAQRHDDECVSPCIALL